MIIKSAKILRLTDNGIGYINEIDSEKISAFSFDKIKGYRGESAKELGLFKGSKINVEYDSDEHINSVSLAID